jgi:hypothetical protein
VRICLNLLMILVLVPGSSWAYTLVECGAGNIQKWGSNSVTVRASATSFPSGSSWRTALQETITSWNRNPSQMRFTLQFGDTSVGFGNFQNEIWFTTDDFILGGASARASMVYDCFGNVRESDIFIDSRIALTTSTSKRSSSAYGGTRRPFQTLAGHELGHTLGLNHTANTYNIMGEDKKHVTTNGSRARFYAGEDASHGLVRLYGTRTTVQDLGVVHWRRSGSLNGYSSHSRTRMFNTSNSQLDVNTINNEPHYRVRRGSQVRVEFSYENNGASRQRTTDTNFYVSTNDFISTADRRIGSRNLDLGRNTVYTSRTTLTIPRDLSTTRPCPNSTRTGCYWIGAIVDADGSLTEVNESNNASYIGIRVVP